MSTTVARTLNAAERALAAELVERALFAVSISVDPRTVDRDKLVAATQRKLGSRYGLAVSTEETAALIAAGLETYQPHRPEPAPAPISPERITLHRICPWNRSLPRGGHNAYAQVGDRKFTIEGPDVYSIYEVGDDGMPLDWKKASEHGVTNKTALFDVLDAAFIALAYNRPGARIAIAGWLNGDERTVIDAAIRTYGNSGTGRNHPRNVERR